MAVELGFTMAQQGLLLASFFQGCKNLPASPHRRRAAIHALCDFALH